MKDIKVLKVKSKDTAKSKVAKALKDFVLIVCSGGHIAENEYSLCGIASNDDTMFKKFLTAMLPFAKVADIAYTVEELEEFWQAPDLTFSLPADDFVLLED